MSKWMRGLITTIIYVFIVFIANTNLLILWCLFGFTLAMTTIIFTVIIEDTIKKIKENK